MVEHTVSVNSPKKASDNIVSLPALSHDRGLALTNTSTETRLRALAKLGGLEQRQRACLSLPPVSRKEKGSKGNKSTRLWGMCCLWNGVKSRDFQIWCLLKGRVSLLLNKQPWHKALRSLLDAGESRILSPCGELFLWFLSLLSYFLPLFLATGRAGGPGHREILKHFSGHPPSTAVWVQNWGANPFTLGYMTICFKRHCRK